jgi:glucan phosphoethanolaminetransferase (alkaline phosphatase superfamily)
MFGEIGDLPVHALAVHATVVAVPLAALLAVLFVIPRTHHWARLPLAIVSVGALISIYVARQSGQHLENNLLDRGVLTQGSPAKDLVDTHYERAKWLWYIFIAFTVIAIVAYALSRNAERYHGVLAAAMSVLLIVGAGAVVFQVYRVGDAGAKAVWNPDGTQDYSTG